MVRKTLCLIFYLEETSSSCKDSLEVYLHQEIFRVAKLYCHRLINYPCYQTTVQQPQVKVKDLIEHHLIQLKALFKSHLLKPLLPFLGLNNVIFRVILASPIDLQRCIIRSIKIALGSLSTMIYLNNLPNQNNNYHYLHSECKALILGDIVAVYQRKIQKQ